MEALLLKLTIIYFYLIYFVLNLHILKWSGVQNSMAIAFRGCTAVIDCKSVISGEVVTRTMGVADSVVTGSMGVTV